MGKLRRSLRFAPGSYWPGSTQKRHSDPVSNVSGRTARKLLNLRLHQRRLSRAAALKIGQLAVEQPVSSAPNSCFNVFRSEYLEQTFRWSGSPLTLIERFDLLHLFTRAVKRAGRPTPSSSLRIPANRRSSVSGMTFSTLKPSILRCVSVRKAIAISFWSHQQTAF